MANIGDLNERLKQKISEKQKATETLIQQELQAFTANLKTEYQNALNTIVSDMRNQNEKLQKELNAQKGQTEKLISEIRKTTVISWIKPSLIAILILLSILGSSWGLMQYLSMKIQDQLEQIDQNQQTLEKLNQAGGQIKLNRCDGRLCAQIDESAPAYQGGYRILKGQ